MERDMESNSVQNCARGTDSNIFPLVLDSSVVVVSFDAFISSTGVILTCVLRNATSGFIEAKVEAVSVSNPCSAESLACLAAMKFAMEEQVSRLVIFGDRKVIIKCLSSSAEPPWKAAHTVQAIVKLNKSFTNFIPFFDSSGKWNILKFWSRLDAEGWRGGRPRKTWVRGREEQFSTIQLAEVVVLPVYVSG
ncbi:hypothetical protein Ancab_016829 [Ancistrocladus abbreviatus]